MVPSCFHTHVHFPLTISPCCSSHQDMEYFCMLSIQGISATHSSQYTWCKPSVVSSEGQPPKSLLTWNAALTEGKSVLSSPWGQTLWRTEAPVDKQCLQPDLWMVPSCSLSQGSGWMKPKGWLQAWLSKEPPKPTAVSGSCLRSSLQLQKRAETLFF